ncbi:MAG: Omp28 family outer membrane lipoprotein [Bacteroidales bacterium]|nr:Omp28 family outer membrane lipoprotein [Bacteroidales bacterium]MCF8326708.1 Omp28 family outer membrane lipoprotein [Bacteroidales bacterium]
MDKKTQIIIIVFLLSALTTFLLSGCDQIEPPYKENITYESKDTVRNVVLEEFTGHLCVNCPSAGAVLHNMKDIYGENLIVISVHAGFFAQTQSAPYDYDFTTAAGEALDNEFGVQSYPIGLVSRINNNGQYKYNVSEWNFYVDSLINASPAALLELSADYNNSSREVDIDVSGSVLSQLDGDYNLSVVITEDSIVKPQKNNDPQMGPTPDIMDYVHNHVLRGSVNGNWGDNYFSGPKDSLDILPQKQYTYTIDNEWRAEHCNVIAFVYRSDDNNGNEYEIIQAAKVKLIP